MPEVTSAALGILETEGTVFPHTDRPRPVNNLFIFYFLFFYFFIKRCAGWDWNVMLIIKIEISGSNLLRITV